MAGQKEVTLQKYLGWRATTWVENETTLLHIRCPFIACHVSHFGLLADNEKFLKCCSTNVEKIIGISDLILKNQLFFSWNMQNE